MEKLTELLNLRAAIEMGGGKEKVEEQHKLGKKTARERIAALIDEGTFVETNAFVSKKCSEYDMENAYADGVVTGYGAVDGRPVAVFSQDATVMGGSMGEMHAQKIAKTIENALKTGVPVIGFTDCSGVRLQEGLDALEGMGKILSNMSDASGVVPMINVVCGKLAGVAACMASMADFTFMIDKTSELYLNGPQVIKGSTNNDLSLDELGGANAHAKSGEADFVCSDEDDMISKVKNLLTYLPDNNLSEAPAYNSADDINRMEDGLNAVVSSGSYSVKTIVENVCDLGSVIEIKEQYATNASTFIARLNGETVGIVANSDELDRKAIYKIESFIKRMDSFNIPVVTFVDVAGFKASASEENGGVLTACAKLVNAYASMTSPKITVAINRACGGAYLVMGSKHIGCDAYLAWADAEIGVMAAEGAANILCQDEIAKAEDPVKAREEMIKNYKENVSSTFAAAKRGYIDDIIEPATTRPRLICALEIFSSKRECKPSKKHSAI
ncbi:MAG: methylmalonyl-CoA carboxyltransferase [Ruminococcaceae bacterium]|nr:methylmalonyl-CoA carboxyltransferase [Oscillospiraceae bacterium]